MPILNQWGQDILTGYQDKLGNIPEMPTGPYGPPVPPELIPPAEPTPVPGGGGLGKFGRMLGGIASKESLQSLFMWSVMSQLIGGLLTVPEQVMSNHMQETFPVVPLTPASMATAVVRGFEDPAAAAQIAKKSGIAESDFQTLVRLAGAAPAPTFLAEALRRGLIPEDAGDPDKVGFMQGIAQGDLADKWADVVKAMSMALPSPEMALDALLEGQTDETTAKDLYTKFGGDPQYFELLFNTRGSAPTPLEASQMANRGIIPWTGKGAGVVSFEQAFLEGPWRDKWQAPYRQLAEYIPTPVEIRSMLSHGVITHEEAVKYLSQRGLSTDVAQMYLDSATSRKLGGAKQLAESTVCALYFEQIVSKQDAAKMLEALKYDQAETDFILQIQDLKREQHALSQALSKIHSLYVGHKISKMSASAALAELHLPDSQTQGIMQLWDLERGANLRVLTESQIVDAFHEELVNQDEAIVMLGHIGYQPWDAWLLLCIKEKTRLPDEPAKPTNV